MPHQRSTVSLGWLLVKPRGRFYQIQAIDQAVSWEAFDYQAFIAHRFAKRYDLAVIILSNDSAIDTQIIQRCRDLFAKHCLVVQNLSEPATGVDVVSFWRPITWAADCGEWPRSPYNQLPSMAI